MRNSRTRLLTLRPRPPSPSLPSSTEWCTNTKLKMLSQSWWVPSTAKTQQLRGPLWTHWEKWIPKRWSSCWLQIRILLHSFKISLSICLLVHTSDLSLTQSWVIRAKKMMTSMLRRSNRWSTTTPQATSKSSWRKSGSTNSTNGSPQTAMEELWLKWTSF